MSDKEPLEFEPKKTEEFYKTFFRRLQDKIDQWLETEDAEEHRFSDYLLFAPHLFLLMVRLIFDDRISVSAKTKLGMAITYFIAPVDMVPEAIVGPVGYVDDIALAVYVLNQLLNEEPEEIIREHWEGNQDLITVIQNILAVADEMIGSGMWSKLKSLISLS